MSRRIYYDVNGNEIYDDAPTYAQEQLADIERRRAAKDVSSNGNVGELKKKILELHDAIDKQNDYIRKYQAALMLASVDIVKTIEEGLEGCDVCPERIYCKAHRHDTIRLDCGDVFLESWKKKAGLF